MQKGHVFYGVRKEWQKQEKIYVFIGYFGYAEGTKTIWRESCGIKRLSREDAMYDAEQYAQDALQR